MPRVTTAFDVIILGAGAAGLLCALTAAKRGRRVLVLEKANKTGKKILMSGGGRCNFTNYFVEPENFVSANPHFCKSALSGFTQFDFIAMVEKHGIEYEERKHGQLFCIHSAKDILAMLEAECRQWNVQIKTHCNVKRVVKAANASGDSKKSNYLVEAGLASDASKSGQSFSCQSLVVATGALSVPSLGGSGMGYDLAKQFDLPVTARRAGLVPFMFSDSMKPVCERLTGTSAAVEVSCNGHSFAEQMLFTHRGISGPAILQISSYWYPGNEINIDLLPGLDASAWLIQAKNEKTRTQIKTLLAHKLPRSLVLELQNLWWPKQAETPLLEIADKNLRDIGEKLNSWRLKPSATEGYRTAEVTLGGVDTDSVSSRTMETRQHPGLYFIGEVLDVSGHLGGFNFQWAWSSGFAAGMVV